MGNGLNIILQQEKSGIKPSIVESNLWIGINLWMGFYYVVPKDVSCEEPLIRRGKQYKDLSDVFQSLRLGERFSELRAARTNQSEAK